MLEHPILFSGPMVRAILDGRKTQTRRVIKHQPPDDVAPISVSRYHPTIVDRNGDEAPGDEIFGAFSDDGEWGCKSPFGEPGDRLWVRESHAQVFEVDIPAGRPAGPRGTMGSPAKPDWMSRYVYSADGPMPNVQWHHVGDSQPIRWTPSIHMPRRASRITLEITGVRVERLKAISEDDAIAEGIDGPMCAAAVGRAPSRHELLPVAVHGYAHLWDGLNAARGYGWDANPWVWAIEFRRVER